MAGMFSVAYSLRFIHDVFFGPPPADLPREPHEPPHWMRVPVEFLVLACLVVGILPAHDDRAGFSHVGGAGGAGRDAAGLQPALWHGFTAAAADEHHRPGGRGA